MTKRLDMIRIGQCRKWDKKVLGCRGGFFFVIDVYSDYTAQIRYIDGFTSKGWDINYLMESSILNGE